MRHLAVLLAGIFALSISEAFTVYPAFFKEVRSCCSDPAKHCKLHGERCPCGIHRHNEPAAKSERKPGCHTSQGSEERPALGLATGTKIKLMESAVTPLGKTPGPSLRAAGCGLGSGNGAALPGHSKEFFWSEPQDAGPDPLPEGLVSRPFESSALLFDGRLERPPRTALF